MIGTSAGVHGIEGLGRGKESRGGDMIRHEYELVTNRGKTSAENLKVS